LVFLAPGDEVTMPKPLVTGLYYGGVDSFIAPDGRPLVTGIRKRPAAAGFLGTNGFPDDASAKPDHHTQDRTVHLFSNENYLLLEARLGVVLPRPTFGENLTTAEMLESEVYVGDHFRVGKAVICVTQPTERCKTIGRSLGFPRILKVLHELELCGFYARVVQRGSVDLGDTVELCERPQVSWSIKRLHQVMFRQLSNDHLVDQVLAIRELSNEWKKRIEVMRGRLRRGEPLSSNLI
jgi:MOSC domain-containing protein YiiM